MGWKDWVYGDLVSAADFQSLVQDQTVQRYASSSARSAALGSAVSEGMVSYLDDTDSVEVYNGSGWARVSNSSGNAVLNSAFDIWQRGTSPTWTANNTTNLQADRWLGFSVATGRTVTRQSVGDTTNLPNIQYCARVQRTAANTATDGISLYQMFETVNSIPFAGKQVTVSFYARAGANFSATSNFLTAYLYSGTGTDQNYVYPGYTGAATPVSGTATLTTTWQRFSFTGTVASTATELALQIAYGPTGTAGAADYFEVTGIQLEVGSSATAFKRNAPSIQGELAACQRYYQTSAGQGTAYSSTAIGGANQFKVSMRTGPTMTVPAGLRNTSTGALSTTATTLFGSTTEGVYYVYSSGSWSPSLSTGMSYDFTFTASAEL